MATEEESSPLKQEDNVNKIEEIVKHVQQEDNIIDEDQFEVKVEEAQQEDKTVDGAQETVTQIQQENKTEATEEKVEQIPQENEVAKTEENVKQEDKVEEIKIKYQLEDEIADAEEKIQKVMDLDQVPFIEEKASDFGTKFQKHTTFVEEEQEALEVKSTITEILEIQPQRVETKGEDFQTAVLNLDGEFPFTTSDGLIPPPPSPALTTNGSHLEMDSSEHDTFEMQDKLMKLSTGTGTGQSRDKVKISRKPKTQQTKRAGFNIGSINEVIDDYGGSDYGSENKVVTGTLRDHEREQQQAECNRYAGYEKFAGNFVDKIIDKSINQIEETNTYSQKETVHEEESTLSSWHTFVEVFGAFTKWPRIQEFSKEIGEGVINEFIQTWEYDEDWMYCINFLLEQSDECSEYYLYEVKWSIPSKPYPIPQATASVYFTIEVSRVKPIYCPVDVTYVFEGSRTIHIPGKIPFQEHWLFNIIDAKLEMYKKIKF